MRILGVEVSASFWFFALILCFALLDRELLLLYFALPIAVHELGHVIVLAVCGVAIREVRFSALGIAIQRGNSAVLPYGREIAICLGGATANALLALGLYLFGFRTMRIIFLIATNIAVALFNLAPIGDLDGGQIVRLLAERNFFPYTAHMISRISSLLMLALLFGLAFFLLLNRWYNPTLLITCGYLAFNVLARD